MIQKPLGSAFGASSTAADVIEGHDLAGRNAIVTGGAAGLGLETVRMLARAGARVIVPARSRARAEKALSGIANVEIAEMNLADPQSVGTFARDIVAAALPLHILVNSAGIMATPFERDRRGNEMQFSANHLGHFQLACGLRRNLAAAGGARIVALSSRGHFYGGVDFDDPNFTARPYDATLAYAQAKTANALFALGADRRWAEDGIRAFSVHPGGIVTGLSKHLPVEIIRQYVAIDDEGNPVIDPENDKKNVGQGAATQLWCAVAPELAGHGGVYCEDCDIALPSPAESEVLRGVKPWASDPELADRLWTLSETLAPTSQA